MNKKQKKIVIVGDGVAGLVLAYRFLESSYEVTLISSPYKDKASLAAYGSFSLKGVIHAKDTFFQEKLEGTLALPTFIKELELKTSKRLSVFFENTVEVFSSYEEYQSLKKSLYHNNFTSHLPFMVLSKKGFNSHKSFDWIKNHYPSIKGAFYYPNDYVVETQSFLNLLKDYLVKKGVRWICDDVKQIVFDSREGLKVECLQQNYFFQELVLACGAGTKSILDRSSIIVPELFFKKGESAIFSVENNNNSFAVYLNKKPFVFHSSKLKCSLHDFNSFKNMTSNNRNSFFDNIKDHKHISGVRVRTKSRKPLIGLFCLPNCQKKIGVFTGFYKSGFSLADIYARRMVQLFSS